MTDISVHVTQYLPENLSWDLTPDNAMAYVEGATLDVTKWSASLHYPNGFIPSGAVVAVGTNGLLAPYLNSAGDSTNVAVGILRASVQVVRPDGTTKAKVGVAVMKAFGVVSQAALPFNSTTQSAVGGFIDATGITDLPRIHFAA